MASTIEAAGVVLVRKTHQDGARVCVIHRPRHRDWSLPKGKRDYGELLPVTAWREAREETNLRVALGVPLSQQQYRVDGRPKSVNYWVARIAGDHRRFRRNGEVDRLEWLSPSKARERLDYPRDVDLVSEALAAPATSPLIVVRHTEAVKRADFKGNKDAKRPLSKVGRIEARQLIDPMRAFGVVEVHSSDSRRCVETVTPLARQLGTKVRDEPLFSEEGFDRRAAAAMQRLVRLARRPAPLVLCTHRPVLPEVVSALGRQFDVKAKNPLLDPALSPGGFIVIHRVLGKGGRVTGQAAALERYDV